MTRLRSGLLPKATLPVVLSADAAAELQAEARADAEALQAFRKLKPLS
jgi:muconolactone delta-isomerase